MSEIVNKIQQSKLETIDLENFLEGEQFQLLDLKQFLIREMILKESEFREQLAQYNWRQYEGQWLAVTCSTNAIIPSWAWMLVVAYANPHVKEVIYGDETDARMATLKKKIEEFNWKKYEGRFVLLKGCSKMNIPAGAYLEATKKLMPVVSKLMYGEACSNVPVYRKSKRS